MVRVSVKNFGPIAEGSVDLKPLTIFIGPSNTGKSFMATAVYAVMKAVEGGEFRRYLESTGAFPWMNRRRMPIGVTLAPEAATRVIEVMRTWISMHGHGVSELQDLVVADLPHEIRSELDSITLPALEYHRNEVILELRKIYGSDSAFVSQRSTSEDFQLIVHRDAPLLHMDIRSIEADNLRPEIDISGASIPPLQDVLQSPPPQSLEGAWAFPNVQFIRNLQESIEEKILQGLPVQTFYMPAARSGIAQGHKVLAAALVGQTRRIGIEPMFFPALPGITTEFLSNLIGLDRRMTNLPDQDALANAIDFIEYQVLHGNIDLDDSGGMPYPDIAYEQDGAGKFRLDQTSSMVSELAPLVLFLKYLVRPGDLLILEEPESHLHPAAQLQMARGIARLVNAGVKVLITTHSGDIIGQIDNLISMSNASEETARSLGLEQVECLQPEQVSAYGFHIDPDLGGAVTYPLPVGSDVGIEDEEFLPVSELLYEQAITLQRNRLI